jgi:hypothetical protein
MLHHALSALKKMYRCWEKSATKPCYQVFVPALTAGMMKLNEYYQHSAKSNAHIMAMDDVSLVLSWCLANHCCSP